MRIVATLILCCCLASAIGQVDDEPTKKDKTTSRGFFNLGLGVHSSTGNIYSSLSYQHLIGHFGGDSYFGLEIGSLSGTDAYWKYTYLPVMLSYTMLIKNPGNTKRFIGYGSIKIGSAGLTSKTVMPGIHVFKPEPPPTTLTCFSIGGGTQLRLGNHFYLFGEAGLGTVYTILFGLTIKL